MRRLLWGSGIAAVFMAVACGSSGTSQDVGTSAPSDGGEAGPSGIIGGGGGLCKPRSCEQAKANCGPVADGCGNLIECGTCTSPAICGGGGLPSVCGGGNSSCTPKTCADLGVTCGPAGDGCGNRIECGTCQAPETCGGGAKLSQCGGNSGCVRTLRRSRRNLRPGR